MADANINTMKGLTASDLTDSLFQEILTGVNRTASLVSWSRVEISNDSGVISNSHKRVNETEMKNSRIEDIGNNTDLKESVGSKKSPRLTGILAFQLDYTLPDSQNIHHKTITLKSKVTGKEILSNMSKVAADLGEDMFDAWRGFLQIHIKDTMTIRELEFVKIKDPQLMSIMPDIYWINLDEMQNIYAFAMEYFDPDQFSHIDALAEKSLWKEADILAVLQGIARFHARYYEHRLLDIPDSLQKHLYRQDKKYLMDLMYFCKSFLSSNKENIQSELSSEDLFPLEKVIRNFEFVADTIDQSPMTLVHNDFCLRNFCLRQKIPPGKLKVCVYDWELICIGQPQHDLAECLIHFLNHDSSLAVWDNYIEKYLTYLKEELEHSHIEPLQPKYLEIKEFKRVFDVSVMALIVKRYVTLYSVLYRKFKLQWVKDALLAGIGYIEKVIHRYAFVD